MRQAPSVWAARCQEKSFSPASRRPWAFSPSSLLVSWPPVSGGESRGHAGLLPSILPGFEHKEPGARAVSSLSF